jgi:hypothetical protein
LKNKGKTRGQRSEPQRTDDRKQTPDKQIKGTENHENTKKITSKSKANEKPKNPARKNFYLSIRYYP